ncbi:FtsK/SpoIIIE domain-containing protein [Leucobacter sp. VD1]|uniref:FtsK/SpoIIIE domain-containing protein n=1 Tax=Leucobacter sp. VD1 TaxID=3080381 RepID=UPI003015D6E6
MKLKVSVALPHGGERDVTLSCDVTATVADVARALIRAGFGADPRFLEIANRRLAPLTLRTGRDGARALLLDPATPVAVSGLQSGHVIQPVPEFGFSGPTQRVIETAASVEVLNGEQRGVYFSLIAGSNVIGRDHNCRVQLLDQSVSRRHAEVRIDRAGAISVRDLGSANGVLVAEERLLGYPITAPTTLRLGAVDLRITPGAPSPHSPVLSHRVTHTRSPRVSPYFPASKRELPAPPTPADPSRMPMLAMLAPMLMGGAMYAITQSPMSLMMVAFSPIMMIGSWLDGRIGGRRKLMRETGRFERELAGERAELAALREQEITVRAAETPTTEEVRVAIEQRDELLWTRRPEHRAFLEVRFGDGILPSRTEMVMPERGEAPRMQWDRVRLLADEFAHVAPVPVIERLDRCGSLGVVGERYWAEGVAASLVLQLVGLHSPHELVFACFAGAEHDETWGWLKWLPHVDPVASPISGWQIADSETSSVRLITAIEGVLESRMAARGTRTAVRSHLAAHTRNDDAQGEVVLELPTLPAIVVLVLEDGLVDPARLIELAETGPDYGVHVLWVAGNRASLPAACRTFVELGRGEGRVHFVRSATIVPLSRHEHVESPLAYDLARRLAPVEDTAARVLDETDLPRAVNLRELHATDLLGGAAPIAQAWADSGSLISEWQQGQDREPISLAAVVGQGSEGPAVLDLRTHGPHALVGGTTGAGKSEFLQSWIMSMAAKLSPDRLTFLLVDYKGGAAFAECVDLPHSVGLVTDLSPHLVRRALTSLRAELRYREELLAAHGAKDLISMERRSAAEAPPVLVIAIDEFAALASDVPEFVAGVIDVAQRGRSLGLHLVMATQRPAGVITDNLRANTNLRVALRMADETDSADVIGVKDAALFDAETPGRGAIKVGPGRITHFQTGYLGGRPSAEHRAADIELRSLGFVEREPWNIPSEARPPTRGSRQARDIERLRDGIVEAARSLSLVPPRRPWLDELPTLLTLATLDQRIADGSNAPIGLRDDPAAQAQDPVCIDFEEAGNVSIIGAGGTGKTSALITLVTSLSAAARSEPVQIYGIDCAGGALQTISPLPTVGAVAPLADDELMHRVLRHLSELIDERGPRYAAVRAGGLDAYRAAEPQRREPRVFLLIDGFAAFRQATESMGGSDSPFQLLGDIMMRGRALGVHVILTSDRASAIPASMSASLQRQFVLRLANSHDYVSLGVLADALEDAPPGRALLSGDDREIQFAVAGGADLIAQSAAIEVLAAEVSQRDDEPAPRIVNAPERQPLSELPATIDGRPVFGIDVRSFEPVVMPFSGLGVIAGPSGAGLSQTALCCVAAVERAAAERGEVLETVLLSFDERGIGGSRHWDRIASGAADIERVAAELVVALGGQVPARGPLLGGGALNSGLGSGMGVGLAATGLVGAGAVSAAGSDGVGGVATVAAEAQVPAFPAVSGARGVIVIERPAEAEGTQALPQLVALVKVARRAGVLVLCEFETGTASAVWDLYQALKQPKWGLSLQPDQHESQSPFREDLGRVRRADFPPGRGFVIENGRAHPVHVAFADSATLQEALLA